MKADTSDLRNGNNFFWFDKEHSVACPEIIGLTKSIAQQYTDSTGKQAKYIKHIVANCYMAWAYSRAVAFFSKNEYWAKYNKKIKDRSAKFSAITFRAEIKYMVQCGLIDVIKGKAVDNRPDLCMASRMQPTKVLYSGFKETWEEYANFHMDVVRIRKDRDSEAVGLSRASEVVSTPATDAVQDRARFLRKYNNFLRSKYFTYKSMIHYYMWDKCNKTTVVDSKTGDVRFIPQLTASYSGSWEQGGRLYARSVFGMADYQQLPKSDRKTIKIDGEDTVELDYSCLHLSLMYARQGLQLTKDAYAWCEDRTLAKKITLIAINTGSVRSAQAAIVAWAIENGYDLDRVKAHKHILNMLEYHSDICHLFMSTKHNALHLQNMDSDIICNILTICHRRNIPAIPVHDSVIVPAKNRNTVARIMLETYKAYTGFTIKIK